MKLYEHSQSYLSQKVTLFIMTSVLSILLNYSKLSILRNSHDRQLKLVIIGRLINTQSKPYQKPENINNGILFRYGFDLI